MKPDHLKRPFTWDKRHVLIHDRVWYVPDQFNDFTSFTFPGWDDISLFGKRAPICIEYCSGNGDWIAAKAVAEPAVNWVAVERKFDRVKKIWSKLKNLHLNNLLAICGEGFRVTQNYFPDASVDKVFINFPDPWPKNRHAKHRIVQHAFVKEILRILKPNGILMLVTDDPAYSDIMIQTLQPFAEFQSLYQDPFYMTDLASYGPSYFDHLWREKGKIIRYHAYQKKS